MTTATQTKGRGILFSAPMVRAILDGRKTQTRRLVDFKWRWHGETGEYSHDGWTLTHCGFDEVNKRHGAQFDIPKVSHYSLCKYGTVGDRLWVRETFGPCEGRFIYRASEREYVKPDDGRWHSPRFMFREVSRIDLEITSIRVERLQEITEEDAEDEGADFWFDELHPAHPERPSSVCAFSRLWDSLHAKDFPWAKSPWVWVIEFKCV